MNNMNITHDQNGEWKRVEIRGISCLVSRDAKVINPRTGKVLRWSLCKKGYPIVGLYDSGRSTTAKVHRIVATAFVENPENKETVNHKDGNKLNNLPENLEWATHAENTKHAWKSGLMKNIKTIPVIAEDIAGFGYYLPSIECSKSLGFQPPNIHKIMSGKNKTHKGFKFEKVEVAHD